MERYSLSSPFLSLLIYVVILLSVAPEQRVLSQLSSIENKIPRSVPLKIGFKNYDKENWWRDLQITAANTGNKPIYYLWLILWLDTTDGNGKQRALSFKCGNVEKFYSTSNEETAREGDVAILPGETYIFMLDSSSVKFWNLLKQRDVFSEPRKAVLDHGFTSFGDGTGLLAGGTPFSQKKNANQF